MKKVCYETFEEASIAFQKIILEKKLDKTKIRTSILFYLNYCEDDPKLPLYPDREYKAVWKEKGGWPIFFQLNQEETRMYTFEEAVQVIQNIYPKPRNSSEYLKIPKKGSRLPLSPTKAYLDFEERGGWDAFLLTAEIYRNKNIEFYDDIFQAKEAIKKLKIKTFNDYKRDHVKDSKLPFDLVWYYGKEAVRKAFGSSTAFQLQHNGTNYEWET